MRQSGGGDGCRGLTSAPPVPRSVQAARQEPRSLRGVRLRKGTKFCTVSVPIDIEELKSKLLQQAGSGLSLEYLRKLLGLERRFAAKLSALGLLPSYSGRKSSTGGRASLVAPCVYDHFVKHYQTVRTWAAMAMITESHVRVALKVNKIRPAPEADGVPVYRIDDLRRL